MEAGPHNAIILGAPDNGWKIRSFFIVKLDEWKQFTTVFLPAGKSILLAVKWVVNRPAKRVHGITALAGVRFH